MGKRPGFQRGRAREVENTWGERGGREQMRAWLERHALQAQGELLALTHDAASSQAWMALESHLYDGLPQNVEAGSVTYMRETKRVVGIKFELRWHERSHNKKRKVAPWRKPNERPRQWIRRRIRVAFYFCREANAWQMTDDEHGEVPEVLASVMQDARETSGSWTPVPRKIYGT